MAPSSSPHPRQGTTYQLVKPTHCVQLLNAFLLHVVMEDKLHDCCASAVLAVAASATTSASTITLKRMGLKLYTLGRAPLMTQNNW